MDGGGGMASSWGHKAGKDVTGALSDKFRRSACIWRAVWGAEKLGEADIQYTTSPGSCFALGEKLGSAQLGLLCSFSLRAGTLSGGSPLAVGPPTARAVT